MSPYIFLALPSYSVMAFVGGFVALLYVYFRIEVFGMQFEAYIKLLLVCVAGAYIGGHLLFIVTQMQSLVVNFSQGTIAHLLTHLSIVFYGGLLGTLYALKLYARHSKYD